MAFRDATRKRPIRNLAFLAFAVVAIACALFSSAFSYVKVEPSSVTVPASNKTVDFQITIVAEPGETNKVVSLSAGWPNPGELSWTERQMIVGTRQSTRVALTPRTPGEFYLKVSLSGEGVLPREEYAFVKITSPGGENSLSDELRELREKVDSIGRKMDDVKDEDTIALYSETNSSIFFAEQFNEEGKYILSENALSVVRENLPRLEAQVNKERKDAGIVISLDGLSVPDWAKSVSFDLMVLIVILGVIIFIAARTFLF